MRLKSLYYLCIFSSVGLFLSCDKENEKEEPKYNMKYSFYISGDESVYSVALRTGTYYPVEQETVLSDKIKHRHNSALNTELWLHNVDSLVIYPHARFPNSMVYAGCRYEYRISVIRYDELNCYETIYRALGTIQSKEDTDIKFIWAQDTAKYEKIFQYSRPRNENEGI